VDERGKPGQFILTGSALPADDITRHTGAGRISRLRLQTMSLQESGHSSAEISLRSLLGGQFTACADPGLSLQDVIEQLCRGGWPGNMKLSISASLRAQRDYLDEIRRVDIVRVDGVRRDPRNVGRVIRSLARNVASLATARTIATDAGGADGPLDDDTVRDYLSALQRLMIYEEQPAWSPQLRSRSILRKSSKRHFVDPSLAVAALGATPDRLLQDFNTLGLLFESMVYRDISVYARANDASIYHYRDNTGLEVDAIVENRQGDWCAFEVKLGGGQVDEAAASLLKFRDRVDVNRSGEPGVLGVIVNSGYGFLRKDGIAVIPVGALGA
jgi:predicted AAA+ superfamily ATPase